MLAKKRKAEGDAAAAAAGQQDDDDQQPPSPHIGRQSLDRVLHKTIAVLLAIENAARSARQQLQSKAEAIKELIEATGGKLELTGSIEGEVALNVGGRVVGVSRKGLMLDQIRHTYLAHLLLYCVDALPRDEEGRPFLDADPGYVKWLVDEIYLVEGADAQGEEYEIELDDTQKNDPTFACYHELFLTKTSLDINVRPADVDMDNGGVAEGNKEEGDAIGQGAGDGGSRLREYVKSYTDAATALEKAVVDLEGFGAAMGPFLRADDGSNHTVRSVTISQQTVSTTEATLARLGPNSLLYRRFSGEVVQGDAPIRQTSVEHFMKVVDFARRQRFETRSGRVVKKPTAKPKHLAQLKKDVEMYGLKMEDLQRPLSPMLNTDETREVLAMIDIPNPTPTLLYSSTRDGGDFGTLLDKVGDASGLLFLVNHNDTHRFGAFVGDQLKSPADPTRANYYPAPTFFISISGAYGQPTKVPLPKHRQWVEVAGRDGSLKATNMDYRGKLTLGRGYLWLCFGTPRPSHDIRRCCHFVEEADLPDNGYLGQFNHENQGTLAAAWHFTAKEIAIYQVKSG
ncbi:unnamed protein product [Vitrella brassicaformis CCMP3155]|uniref:TLDc domain-containing protein n=1 Tax=Vitrella brassicaformis (strain CCMP3155) TaxID=1169540 RepID=A0A0G4FRV7_VITBC|nr:unnamed protein product [Vitrella brassicaformis CCMP3155]|eukprot:CEM17396.1 unnamed protein product [Vitrella brassicaformis CCMP3155]